MLVSAAPQHSNGSVTRLFRRLIGVPKVPAQTILPEQDATREHFVTRPRGSNILKLPPLLFDGSGSINSSRKPIRHKSLHQLSCDLRTSAFLLLPAEIRNIIYEYTFALHLDSTSIPQTHYLPPGAHLLLTCKQISQEAQQYFYNGALIHALHPTRAPVSENKKPTHELVKFKKSIFLPASNIEATHPRYLNPSKVAYTNILRHLSPTCLKPSPTTLVFTTDCRIGGFEQRSLDSRCARYASALLDLRFALSLLSTIERIYVVDIGKPVHLATRDYFVDMFTRCFPNDAEKVEEMQQELMSDPGSLTWYDYKGLKFYTGIPGSDEGWRLQRPEGLGDGKGKDGDLDFEMQRDGMGEGAKVYVFANWIEFCRAYRGPVERPERGGGLNEEGGEMSFFNSWGRRLV
jgi:hypothetical protein